MGIGMDMAPLADVVSDLRDQCTSRSGKPRETGDRIHSDHQPSEPAAWPRGVARASWRLVDPPLRETVLAAARDKRWPLVLAGTTGSGKSCLAALLATRVPHWRFIECSELLTAIMTCRTSDAKTAQMHAMNGTGMIERSETEIMSWCENAPILVLDDVGTRQLSEAQADALLRVINSRMGKPLVITTNCTESQLRDHIGERIVSRLMVGARYRLKSVDRRVQK